MHRPGSEEDEMVNVETSVVIQRPIDEVFGRQVHFRADRGRHAGHVVDGRQHARFLQAGGFARSPMFNRGMRADLANLKALYLALPIQGYI